MNAQTTKILEEILDREGWPVYTEPTADHPDRGGATKGGITLGTLKGWRERPTRRQDLQALGKDEALEILRRQYVESCGIDRLEGLPVFAQVVDNAVLSGPYRSACDLQKAIGVKVDGMIGPVTCAAVDAHGDTVGAQLVRARALRIAAFVQAHPTQLVFLKGWMRRVLGFLGEG